MKPIIYCFVLTLFATFNPIKNDDLKTSDDSSDSITIQNLNVQSRIQVRFATTWVTSRIKNSAKKASQAVFLAQIPNGAFITNFSMQIDDKVIYGNVKEKEEAKQAFEAAKARGESTGLVAKQSRESNIFQIMVNLAAESKVNFNLTYQEILQRVHGVYKHVIDVRTNYPVESINIEVNINERGEITDLKVPRFEENIGDRTNKELLTYASEKDAEIERSINANQSAVTVKYSPKSKQQEKASGQLAILYDVRRDKDGGSIEVVDGYFIHFFAPEGLPKINKKIVFVLDKSGSMMGRKFQQLQQAVKIMLNELNPQDVFNIVFFSTTSEVWKKESLKATPENIKAAQQYVADTDARGSTDIFGSLTLGLKTLDAAGTDKDAASSMIIFLTDGQPTEGVTDGSVIVNNITEANNNRRYIINCIGFGEDVDMVLMKRIASKNRGLAKKIYEDSDATLQLTGFYDEISNPLLSQVKIKYLNDTVDVNSIIQSNAADYFDGGEIVTIGKVKDRTNENVQADITASGQSGSQNFRSKSASWICPRWGWGCCPRPIPYIGGPVADGRSIYPPCCWGDMCPPPWPRWTTPAPKAPLPPNTLGGFVERMWAYQTIKMLLKKVELDESEKSGGTKEESRKKALDLSLKYNFVTDLTSMVVVQSQTDKVIQLEKVDKKPPPDVSGGFAGSNIGPSVFRSSNGVGSGFGQSSRSGALGRPAPTMAVDASKWDSGRSFGGATSVISTEEKKEAKDRDKEQCKRQIFIVLNNNLDKSPNGKTTDVMASSLILKLTLDRPDTSAEKIIASLSPDGNSTSKSSNFTAEISNKLRQPDPKTGKPVDNKNTYVVLFAPYQKITDSVVGNFKSLAKNNHIRILVIVLEHYTKERLAQMADLAGSDKNVLVDPSLNDVLIKMFCT